MRCWSLKAQGRFLTNQSLKIPSSSAVTFLLLHFTVKAFTACVKSTLLREENSLFMRLPPCSRAARTKSAFTHSVSAQTSHSLHRSGFFFLVHLLVLVGDRFRSDCARGPLLQSGRFQRDSHGNQVQAERKKTKLSVFSVWAQKLC